VGHAGGAAPEVHLFVVHSPVARWVTHGVIECEGLDRARVVLALARGMTSEDGDLRTVPLPMEAVRESPTGLVETWRARRWMRRNDRRIARATGGRPFHLYLPHALERAFQLLRSHPGCTGFSYLEEGLYSYCTRAEMDRIHPPPRIRRGDRLAFSGRVRAAHFFEPGHRRAYALYPDAFPDLDDRAVVRVAPPPVPEALRADVAHVIAFDALSATRQVRLESVCAGLDRLLDRLRSEGVARVHYKLHPAQRGHPEVARLEATLARWAPGLVAQRLDDRVSLEGLAYARPELRAYVNLSSIGLYAALAGRAAFTWAPYVVAAEPAFAAVVDRAPKIFREKVRPLEDPQEEPAPSR